ncbi:thioesterase family protein [Lutibacter sp.]|uniref:acyl-CoA thioesterase n=1 Tax=Lutibacter sp. TaxID=1925666 RepID=UPI0025B7F519|nr:thioesterase family protein [Lutibacter sp.]MCF6167011.1 acyl-CoA thioesterase [Lutibacter sp.]
MNKKVFAFQLTITEDVLDALNHVNNVYYLQWVQNAAQKHWDILSTPDLNSKYVWIVLRHEIDYLYAAKLHDEIIISTWVESLYGVKSERIVEIKKNAKLIARAKTTWCLLAKKTMKPVRIPTEIMKIFKTI